jgi:hypothetical protein
MEPIGPSCQMGLPAPYLSHHGVVLLLDHKHGELVILNEISTSRVIGL